MTQYQTIYSVIRDCGDGSQSIDWFKTLSDKDMEVLETQERYQSGDGVQVTEYKFPVDFDIENWARINNIYWASVEEEYDF
jgi:hypothetical protein